MQVKVIFCSHIVIQRRLLSLRSLALTLGGGHQYVIVNTWMYIVCVDWTSVHAVNFYFICGLFPAHAQYRSVRLWLEGWCIDWPNKGSSAQRDRQLIDREARGSSFREGRLFALPIWQRGSRQPLIHAQRWQFKNSAIIMTNEKRHRERKIINNWEAEKKCQGQGEKATVTSWCGHCQVIYW